MPTGYTADVQSGKITEFRDFAMQCARAFGACIMMRDEPCDKPIPDAFAPSVKYHEERLAKAQARLTELQAMAPEQCAAARDAWIAERTAEAARAVANKTEHAKRYHSMLAQVDAWEPPTLEHAEMKNFMLEQLRSSIEFDCGTDLDYLKPPEPISPEQWRANEMAEAGWNIEYSTKAIKEEIERTAKRNAWLKALRESLEPERAEAAA